MGLLEKIQTGRQAHPPRLLIYGVEGVGKSTIGAAAPNPIFVPTEDGLGQIDCHHFPLCESFAEVTEALKELAAAEHDYQTVVIDSLDWLEQLLWEQVCQDYGVRSIEKVDGGYGKGYTYAVAHWRKLINQLVALHQQRHMAVILLAHAKVERFQDPESTAYDRYSPRLHKNACALVTEWCDAVLFATRRFRTQTEDAGFNRVRTTAQPVGAAGGERILRTVGGPACIAKNRYDLPAELPLDWSALMQGILASQTSEPVQGESH